MDEQLRNAVIAYHQALESVLEFTRTYLEHGGNPRIIPEKWNELDLDRQAKYAAMIKAAGVVQ